jgi:predicted P-loop ATPase
MEVQELSGFNKTDSEKLKAYISTQFDKYRVPYSRRPELIPRTFVLVGSTNHSAYLNDSTGNARFYPVKCNPKEGKINLERLREDIDQILAESYQLYLEGFKWYPVNPEQEKLCSIEQEASADIDLWEPIIEDAIKDLESIKIDDVVKSILRLDINKVNRSSATRIGRILAKLGWIKERPQIDGERSYIYKRKSD